MADRIRLGVALSELAKNTRQQRAETDAASRVELDAFCQRLSDATGLSIVAYAAPRYDRLLTRLKAGEVDLAWLSPVMALAALRADVLPIAMPSRGESSWYWSALFVREDSSLFGLANLHQARAVWVDRDSASGYLVIRASLAADGFDIDRGFRSEAFAGSHGGVVREVTSDTMAVGATFVHLDAHGTISRAGWGGARVRELKRAGPIPSDVLAASSALAARDVERIRSALCERPSSALTDAAEPLFGAARFTAVDRSQLAHLQALERYLIRSATLPAARSR